LLSGYAELHAAYATMPSQCLSDSLLGKQPCRGGAVLCRDARRHGRLHVFRAPPKPPRRYVHSRLEPPSRQLLLRHRRTSACLLQGTCHAVLSLRLKQQQRRTGTGTTCRPPCATQAPPCRLQLASYRAPLLLTQPPAHGTGATWVVLSPLTCSLASLTPLFVGRLFLLHLLHLVDGDVQSERRARQRMVGVQHHSLLRHLWPPPPPPPRVSPPLDPWSLGTEVPHESLRGPWTLVHLCT